MHVELRSDTFTKPTPEMLEAMMAAPVGDDVFEEDPSVNSLEEKAAALFGMEKALFCPSGTMTNQIAINVHTRPGDEVICEEGSHVYFYEGGGIAKNSSCQVRTISGNRGQITAQQIAAVINPDDVHRARTRLVSLENTCNRGGGSCYDIEAIADIQTLCKKHELSLHLDGARLFNALVAKNQSPKDFGQLFDSISICLSKGLGAPVGSLLLGSAAFIKEARRVRKVFGGGMRQAGFLAAAGSFALEHHIQRLNLDHQHAQLLGNALAEQSWVKQVLPVETNIVIFETAAHIPAAKVIEKFKNNQIYAVATGPQHIRFVTHLDVSPIQIEYTIEQIKGLNL